MRKRLLPLLLAAALTPLPATAQPAPDFAPIRSVKGQLNMVNGHIQGIAAAPDAIYLSCLTYIIKLDWHGQHLKHVRTPNHTGDLAFHDGTLYAAIALRKPDADGNSGLIQAYDADLNLLSQTVYPKGTDGITVLDGTLYFGVGPNPPKAHRGNSLAKAALPLPKALPHQPVTVDHGHKTHYGYQNLTTDGQRLLGFLYAAGNPFGGVILDRNLNVLKLLPFAAGNGIDLLPRNLQEDGKPLRFIRCRTLHNWRKTDVANDPPQVILEFFELRDDNTLAPLHKATAK